MKAATISFFLNQEDIMKILFKLVLAISLIVSLAGVANANDRGVNGLIIGSGAGALMGQAVGRNVESTIIGATVGGIIGAVIGAEGSHHQQQRVIIHEPAHRQHGRYLTKPPTHYSPRVSHNRPHWRGNSYSKETIVIYKQQGDRKNRYYNNSRPHPRQHQSSHNNYRRPYKNHNR